MPVDSGHALRVSMVRYFRRVKALMVWKRLSFAGLPVVFGNAMPKSGSKLMLQVLQGLTRVGPFVETGRGPVRTITIDGRTRSPEEILSDLRRLSPGDVGWGYLRATAENMQILCGPHWATYFILRDPRDMLVSHVYYATDMYEGHGMHDYYNRLPDMAERLKVAIQGVQEEAHQLPGVGERYRRMVGWLDRKEVLTVHFEDFILDRENTIDAMLKHLEAAGYRQETFLLAIDRQAAIRKVMAAIDPQKSPTFRKGSVGDWREHFTVEHKRLFKEVAGDLLIRLGYEKDNDW